jgi:outer membrane protein assembly factor BamB
VRAAGCRLTGTQGCVRYIPRSPDAIDTMVAPSSVRRMTVRFAGTTAALAVALVIIASVNGAGAASHDWYRWRGPDLNGISPETGWSTAWPSRGPKKLWKVSVGIGFSSVSVAEGRVYTMGNRNDKDTVYAFDAETGQEIWRHTYDCALDPRYYEGGTSCTPTVDADRVYTLSRKGHLFCFATTNGHVIWQKNISDELGLSKAKDEIPEWGYASSPLVQDKMLVLNVGSAGTAVDKGTGKLIWSSGKSHAGYATPVPCDLAGSPAVAGLHAVNLSDGKRRWTYDWETSYDVNAADPIIRSNRIFISSGYGRGAAVLEFTASGATKVWENKELRNQISSSVLIRDHVYGMDGNNGDRGSSLRCLEFATGKLKWTDKSARPGALMAAGEKLIVLNEAGELIVANASPDEFRPLARAQVLGGKCWTTPVLSNGRIYCRNAAGDLVAVDVKAIVAATFPGR